MATSEEQTILLKVVTGLFNAAPGSEFLPGLENSLDSGVSQLDLAKAMAALPIFTDTLGATPAEQGAMLAGNFGLTADNVDGSPASLAIQFFTDGITAGTDIGELVYIAVTFLEDPNLDAAFAPTALLLNNKAAVSAAYSAAKGSSSLADLQAALSGVTGDAVLTEAEIAALVEAAPGDPVVVPTAFTLTSDVTSAGVQEGTAATFTVTVSEAVAEDTVVTFTVVPSDTTAADQGTNDTNLNDFSAGTFNPQTAIILAGQTTATFTVSGQVDGITELPESYSVTATIGSDTLSATVNLVDGAGTFTLTTLQDNVVGATGDDTVIGLVGTGATLTLGDVINGNDGNDTLSLTSDAAAVNLATADISNVENLIVNSAAAAAGAQTLNAGGIAFNSIIAKGVTGTDAGATIYGLSNLETSTAVTLEDFTDSTTTITFNSVTGSSDSANVTIKGAVENAANGDNDLNVAGIETLNLTFANGNTNTIVNDIDVITAAAATTVNVNVDADSATIVRGAAALGAATAVNIVAASNLTLSATAALANDAVITASGAGDVDLNTLDDNGATNGVTVNATGLDGGLTATTGANTVSVNTGSGADTITMGATVITAVNTGAGDDTVNLGANDQGSATTNATIDGGDGTDVLGITVAANFDAATLTKAVNFETLALGGAAAGTYSMKDKGFTGVLINADTAADGVIVSGITNETISFADTGNANIALTTFHTTFALDDASGTSDTLEIDITGAQSTAVFGHPGGAGTVATTDDTNDLTIDEIVIAGVETVTLDSNTHADNVAGVSNVLTSLSTDAATLKVTGDHVLTITTFDTEVAGTDAANITLTSIDASGSAGLIMGQLASTQAMSILGSENADTLVVGTAGSTINAGQGRDSITSTAGASDTLITNASDSQIGFTDANTNGAYDVGEELHDTVVGFVSGEDTIDLGSFGFTGQLASALAGPALTSAAALELVDGTTSIIDDFFIDTGVQRGTATVSGNFANIGGGGADTLVFVDTNGNGDLDVGTDDMIVLSGTAAVALADFGF